MASMETGLGIKAVVVVHDTTSKRPQGLALIVVY